MFPVSRKLALSALFAATLLAGAAPSHAAGPLSLSAFQRETGIRADEGTIQQTWTALQAMGTDKYVGGMLGGLKLDESSLIAGALSIGASELDNLLGGGGLLTSALGAGGDVLGRMTSASGIDLSYLTGSFTAGGGGSASAASMLSGASSGDGACDSSVASALASGGQQHVEKIVNAAMSGEYGFSKIGDLAGQGSGGSGFASLGCLDKLFQNAGSDIMFKPPSLGSLTNSLQNWVCGQSKSVADQVAGAFGSGDIFQTASLGGFYPSKTFGEANSGAPNRNPGTGQSPETTFGSSFADFESASNDETSKSSSILSLYR